MGTASASSRRTIGNGRRTNRTATAGRMNCRKRVWKRTASALVSLDIGDDVLDGADFLGVLVGDFDVEFLLQRHHQVDDVERIRVQVRDKRGLRGYFVGGHTQLLAYLLANFGFDVLSHRALVPPGSAASRAAYQHSNLIPRANEIPARISLDACGDGVGGWG